MKGGGNDEKSICVLFFFILLFVMAGCTWNIAARGQESISGQSEVQTEQSIDHKESSETETQEPSESVSGVGKKKQIWSRKLWWCIFPLPEQRSR